MSAETNYEGWFTDPYGVHEAWWMSGGQATKLVRDAGLESYDPPPEGPFTQTPTPVQSPAASGSNDLRRADDLERGDPYDAKKAWRGVEDVFTQTHGE
jgi:hypothetical protein